MELMCGCSFHGLEGSVKSVHMYLYVWVCRWGEERGMPVQLLKIDRTQDAHGQFSYQAVCFDWNGSGALWLL